MWMTSTYRCAAKEQQRDKGLGEPGEAEFWKSVDQKGGVGGLQQWDGLRGPGEA